MKSFDDTIKFVWGMLIGWMLGVLFDDLFDYFIADPAESHTDTKYRVVLIGMFQVMLNAAIVQACNVSGFFVMGLFTFQVLVIRKIVEYV